MKFNKLILIVVTVLLSQGSFSKEQALNFISSESLALIRFSNETDINDRLLVFSIGYKNGGQQALGSLIQGKSISLKGRF